MILSEVKQKFGGLPRKAGIAVLNWGARTPSRVGKTITLPTFDGVEFFPLLSGAQFLLHAPGLAPGLNEAFFGGTDEQPFLVQLEPSVVATFRSGGEQEFYTALKPVAVDRLEERFSSHALRQGDWFAVRFPDWSRAKYWAQCSFHRDGECNSGATEKGIVAVGGTRHTLKGRFLAPCRMMQELRSNCPLVGEGVLEAPDHADKVLKGPHAFFQTARLANPEAAD